MALFGLVLHFQYMCMLMFSLPEKMSPHWQKSTSRGTYNFPLTSIFFVVLYALNLNWDMKLYVALLVTNLALCTYQSPNLVSALFLQLPKLESLSISNRCIREVYPADISITIFLYLCRCWKKLSPVTVFRWIIHH